MRGFIITSIILLLVALIINFFSSTSGTFNGTYTNNATDETSSLTLTLHNSRFNRYDFSSDRKVGRIVMMRNGKEVSDQIRFARVEDDTIYFSTGMGMSISNPTISWYGKFEGDTIKGTFTISAVKGLFGHEVSPEQTGTWEAKKD